MAGRKKPQFFKSQAAFRKWLAVHHDQAEELVVGYWKKSTGVPSVTWEQSRDEALCFGWIDGVRRKLDDERYTIRFTPRRSGSTWSAVNVDRVEAMVAQAKMTPAGLTAFAQRTRERTATYSYETESQEISGELRTSFEAHESAFRFFRAQPPGYRRSISHWVMSAKREETRARRLQKLIAACERGERLK